MDIAASEDRLAAAVDRATAALRAYQRDDGHFVFELEADATIPAEYVLLEQLEGQSTMVPRWMADAAHREQVGGFLALVSDKLAEASAVVEAVPAIEIDDPPEIGEIGRAHV